MTCNCDHNEWCDECSPRGTTLPSVKDYEDAYVSLLRVTGEPWRSRYCQKPLAVLRDTIASMTGWNPQDVQDEYELKAEEALKGEIL